MQKFQKQNQAAALKLKQEVADALTAQSPGQAAEISRDLLRRCLTRLKDDENLAQSERQSLIRQVEVALQNLKTDSQAARAREKLPPTSVQPQGFTEVEEKPMGPKPLYHSRGSVPKPALNPPLPIVPQPVVPANPPQAKNLQPPPIVGQPFFPQPAFFNPGHLQVKQMGFVQGPLTANFSVTPIVSPDRRFVRVFPQGTFSMTTITANSPMIPITIPVPSWYLGKNGFFPGYPIGAVQRVITVPQTFVFQIN